MNKRKFLAGTGVIVVAALLIVAVLPHSVEKTKFGFVEKITASSLPFTAVTGYNTTTFPLNDSLSFQALAQNPTVINPKNMSASGWSTWKITSHEIILYGDGATFANISTSHVTNFVDIFNSVSSPTNLDLTPSLHLGRVASYAILNNNMSINADYIVSVSNGTNYTLEQSNSSNGTVVGRGTTISNEIVVTLLPHQYFALFLSTIPSTHYAPSNESTLTIAV